MRLKNACRQTNSPTAYPSPARANCLPGPAAGQTSTSSRPNRRGSLPDVTAFLPRRESRRGKSQQVRHIGEQSSMARNALQHPRILILHFALNAAAGGKCVSSSVGGIDRALHPAPGKIPSPPSPAGAKISRRAQRSSDSRDHHFKRLAQQNEARVGVLGARARLSLERQLQAGPQQRRRRGRGLEKLDISRQPRVVRQQVPQLHPPGQIPAVRAPQQSPAAARPAECRDRARPR